MSIRDTMFSAGARLPRRWGGHVGLFRAGTHKPRRAVARWVMLIVLIVSIVGLWTSAGLAQAAGATVMAAADAAPPNGGGAPAAWLEPAAG